MGQWGNKWPKFIMKKSTLFLLILLVVAVTSCKTTQSTAEYNDPKPSVTDVVEPNFDVAEEPAITYEMTEEEVVAEPKEDIKVEIEEEKKEVLVKTVKEPEEDGAYKNIEVIRYKIDWTLIRNCILVNVYYTCANDNRGSTFLA